MNAHLRQSLGQQNKMRAYRRAAPPLIDVLIHFAVREAPVVMLRLLMTSEPLKTPVRLIRALN